MRLRKKPYILLEMCIGLVISGMLLSVLLKGYLSFIHMDSRLEKARSLIIARQKTAAELATMFSTIPAAIEKAGFPRGFYQLESEEALYFLFDYGVHPSPDFSGVIYGALKVDKDKQLHLLFWPLEQEKQIVRSKLLLPAVEDLYIEFFVETKDSFEWSPTLEGSCLPSMLRISFVHEGDPLSFAFFLPTMLPVISVEIPS